VALLVPCRNALFARLNLLLPEAVKRYVLHGLYPASVHFAGFRAYYDHCTPSELEAVVRQAGLHLVEKEVYHWSGYFDFFAPFYLCWRAASLLAVALFGEDACDRFCLVAVRAE
jgi:2-polyprenyl-6-hydroxyphenyl methylase/3-demethylubiquinone-9 3-methyltransferase